jgi:hypothetical protein
MKPRYATAGPGWLVPPVLSCHQLLTLTVINAVAIRRHLGLSVSLKDQAAAPSRA